MPSGESLRCFIAVVVPRLPTQVGSVAELNIGIICACIPVVFVVFKGMARRANSWVTKLRSSTASGGEHEGDGAERDKQSRRHRPRTRETFKALRSFMQKGRRANLEDAELALTQTAHRQVHTFVSANDDYHTHLYRVRGEGDNRNEHATKTWQLTRTSDRVEEEANGSARQPMAKLH